MKTFKQFIAEKTIFGMAPHNVGAWDHEVSKDGGEVTEHPISHTVGNEDKKEWLEHPSNKEYLDNMTKNYSSGNNKPPPVSGTPHPENPKVMSVIDGNHRLHAAKKAGMDKISVRHVPHEDVNLLHPDYTPDDDIEKTIRKGTPLSHFREKDGSYDMDKSHERLGGLTLRHYFANSDGTYKSQESKE